MMNKSDFLCELSAKISSLPKKEQEEIINYYTEMISERVEDGMTEEQAVEAFGSVDEIAEGILLDAPMMAIIKDKVKPRCRLRAWEIILIALGSPIWLTLLVVAFAILFVLYILIWTVVAVLYIVFGSLAVSSLAVFAAGVALLIAYDVPTGLALVGVSLVIGALSMYFLLLSNLSAKGGAKLSVLIVRGVKASILKSKRKEKKA